MTGIKLIYFHCAWLCILPLTFLSTELPNWVFQHWQLGGKIWVENKAWVTEGRQQRPGVIFIFILSQPKGNAWLCLVHSSQPYGYATHTIKGCHVFGHEYSWEEKYEGRWGGGGMEMQLLSLLLNCTILSKEKPELCKSWPDAYIWQWSDCFVSRRFPHSMKC